MFLTSDPVWVVRRERVRPLATGCKTVVGSGLTLPPSKLLSSEFALMLTPCRSILGSLFSYPARLEELPILGKAVEMAERCLE